MKPHFFIGIDRSDFRLDLCILNAAGEILEQSAISTDPEAMLAWARKIEAMLLAGARAALCIEQPCPGLLNFFRQFEFLTLHLINPLTLKHYREAFNTSRAKDDKQLRGFDHSIRRFDTLIEDALNAHQDAAIFTSLPGAGPNLSARLAAFFGTDRSLYPDPDSVQNHSGVSPVTKQSGKTHFVHRRYACCKFWRQTFVENR